MKEIYLNNVVEHFHITLPEEGLEDPYQLEELAVNMISEKESSYGEEALWEAYTLRKKFYGNDVTNIQVLKCLLPLVRAYNRNEGKHEQVCLIPFICHPCFISHSFTMSVDLCAKSQVINLLEPVLTELQIKQDREGLERREWIAKCLNLLSSLLAYEHQRLDPFHSHRPRSMLLNMRRPRSYESGPYTYSCTFTLVLCYCLIHCFFALHASSQILQKARGLHDYGTVQALRSLAANYIQRDHYVEGEK